MTATASLEKTAPRLRSSALDRLRGLAILCMVTDHLALFAGLLPLRYTVGRLAMPLFVVLAGHLARRTSWRHGWLLLLGFLLPLVAPWVDSPNVLLWLGLLCPLVAYSRRWPVLLWLLLGWCLTVFANPSVFGPYDYAGTGYPSTALLGLLVLGALLDRATLERAGRVLPAWLAAAGRFPLSLYVGHVLLLTVVFSAPGS